jgi:hypothetical protein
MANSAIAPLHPPYPPHYFGFGIQATNYSSDKLYKFPLTIAACDSRTATEAKAQHDPHDY